jgi:hypothetical protein
MKSRSGIAQSITARFVALLLTAPLLAAGALLYDGNVPIYPNAVIAGSNGKLDTPEFKKALQIGFALFADTKDAPKTVVSWYRGRLPASYTLHQEAAGSQFKGGGNVINVVVYKGQTRIAIVPEGKR